MKKRLSVIIFISSFLILPTYIKAADFVSCNSGIISGDAPLTSIPTYDYGSNGLVRFHFKMSGDWTVVANNFGGTEPFVDTNFFDQNCQKQNTVSFNSSFDFPNVPNFMLKAEPLGNGLYHFVPYNEDTGKIVTFSAPLANVYASDIVQLSFTVWPNSTFRYYGTGATMVTTPAASVTNSDFNSNNKRPILIIPGVLGTNLDKGSDQLWVNLSKMATDVGDNFMDPLQFNQDLTPLDYSVTTGQVIRLATMTPSTLVNYDYLGGLIQEFIDQGYKEGTSSDATLFTFPYDWRYGVSDRNVYALKQKIQDILTQTGADKVDVVAHSTGGLLLKKYIADDQDSHIGKAVFVGVPNLGSPKAIKVLLQGDNFGVPWLADSEMQKISQNLPVVYDLAPSEQYVDTNGGYITTITTDGFSSNKQKLNFDQTNNFLINDHQFNSQALTNAQNLHTINFENLDLRTAGVDVYSIVGCKTATLSKINENLEETVHGPVVTGYSINNNISGDGTVPMSSAQSIVAGSDKTFYAIKADHGKMPSQDGIRQEIVNIISGSILDTSKNIITQDQLNANPNQCKLTGHWWQIFSPVSIQVTDQDGNISQVVSNGSIQNDIPGADYEVWGDHKFVFVPTDEGQTYTINLKGTGNGTFTFKDETIANDQVVSTQVFSDIPVAPNLTGTVNVTDSTTTLALDNNNDGRLDSTILPTSIINTDESLDTAAPSTTPVITGTQDLQGNYNGEVRVDFSVTDPVVEGQENQTSGVLVTRYSLDGADFIDYASSSPVSVKSEGQHLLTYFSVDRAGNNEPVQTLQFTIKQAPAQQEVIPPAPPPAVSSGGGGGPPPLPPSATTSPVILVTPINSPAPPSATSSQGSVLGDAIINSHTSGTLILFPNDLTVYLLNQNAKHPFFSAQDFLSKGFKFENVLPALPGDALFPLGMVM